MLTLLYFCGIIYYKSNYDLTVYAAANGIYRDREPPACKLGVRFLIKFKVFVQYFLYWVTFIPVFCVMFVLLTTAVFVIPLGIMMAVFGIAIIMFKAKFVITELAPQVMLFGGLTGAFLAGFMGLAAIKLGFFISRRFLTVKRRCDRLRGWLEPVRARELK